MITICTVARFDYVKGLDVAIKAMSYLRFDDVVDAFKYIIVGDGDLKSEIEDMVKGFELNDKIELLGNRDDVPDILKSVDIYLCPSRSESMSLTLLEAMGVGLPIVATDIEGNQWAKHALFAKPESPRDMADVLTILIKNKKLRRRLGERGRILVKDNYSLDKMIHDTEQLYEEVLQCV